MKRHSFTMIRRIGFVMCIIGAFLSCDVKNSDTDPSAAFSRVYDHPDMDISLYPVDLEQLPDGSFLILSVYTDTALSTFPLIHLMKTDKAGLKIWDSWVDNAYVSAVPSIFENGGVYYFICMDAVNQETRVMQIDVRLGSVTESTSFSTQYPLYCTIDKAGDILILNFDRQNRTSILSKYNENFAEIWSTDFSIIDDVRHQIETHLTKTGPQFPFFIGQMESVPVSHYFVNCFYNYTMTMLFTHAGNGSHTGTVYTYQDDAAVSSAVNLGDNRFALSRYYLGDNFVNPSAVLNPATIQSITDFSDFFLPELEPNAPIRCLHIILNGNDVVVFASQTRTNQLALFFYDTTGGTLLSAKFLNEKYPVSLAGMEFTQEEGLALLVQTYIVGRFPRISLIKLSPDDLKW